MGSTEYRLYLDTNTFLHYKYFVDIDWCEVFNLKMATLIICYPVLKELDKHKMYHTNLRIRKRAKKALGTIRSLLNNGIKSKLNDNTIIEFAKAKAKIDWAKEELSNDSVDDQIIACVISDKKRNKYIITADVGLQLASKLRGIKFLELPDSLLLPIQDPRDKKIDQLEKQLSKKPELQFGALEGHSISKKVEIKLVDFPSIEFSDIEKKVIKIGKNLLEEYRGQANIEIPLSDVADLRVTFEQFEEHLECGQKQLLNYLKKFHFCLSSWADIYNLKVIIANNGTAPVNDLDIEIIFPPEYTLFSSDNIERLPPLNFDNNTLHATGKMFLADQVYLDLNAELEMEQSRIYKHLRTYDRDLKIDNRKIYPIEVCRFSKSSVSAELEKVKQNDKFYLDIYFSRFDHKKQIIEIDCSINADEIDEVFKDSIIIFLQEAL